VVQTGSMHRYQQQNTVGKKKMKCSVNCHWRDRVSGDIKNREESVGIKMGIPRAGCKEVQKTLTFFVIKRSMMVAHCHMITGNGWNIYGRWSCI